MTLADMEAIAADLSDIGGRVAALEAQLGEGGGGGDTIAVPTNIFIGSGAMTWLGGWDRESAYTPGETVSFGGSAWVNIAEVTAKPAKLVSPLPEPSRTGSLKPAQYVNAGEKIDFTIKPKDLLYPFSKGVFGATNYPALPARVFQFRVATPAKIFCPGYRFPSGGGFGSLQSHFDLYNSDKQTHTNFFGPEGFAGSALVAGVADPTLFYLVVYIDEKREPGGAEEPEGGHTPRGPAGFTLNLSTTEHELVEEPGNATPPNDPEHWTPLPHAPNEAEVIALIESHSAGGLAIAPPGAISAAVPEGVEQEASATKDTLVTLLVNVPGGKQCLLELTVDGVKNNYPSFPEVAGEAVYPVSFVLKKKGKWKWALGVGGVTNVKRIYQTLD